MKSMMLGCVAASLLMTACNRPVPAGKIINQQASVPVSFGFEKMRVIASSINKKQHTMSTLYGNPVSVMRARSGAKICSGEKLVLVTWRQKADENWFGANIPGQVQKIEQITTQTSPKKVSYRLYTGKMLAPDQDTIGQSSRIKTILSMQASIMP